MRTRFQQGLDDLRQRLLRMGGLAEQAVDRARQAYVDRDLARCQMVLEGESLINTAEREIDEAAFDLLAMQQPMAVDLRFILAVTKINSDLERVGDQAVNIAERVMDMVEMPPADLPVDIARMGAAVSAMVRRSLESFIEGKAELAQAVLEMDNVVDRMKDDAFIQLVKTMNQRPEVVRQALDALLVARNLERVADHATNIAEDVIFWVQGADVRHNASTESIPSTRRATRDPNAPCHPERSGMIRKANHAAESKDPLHTFDAPCTASHFLAPRFLLVLTPLTRAARLNYAHLSSLAAD